MTSTTRMTPTPQESPAAAVQGVGMGNVPVINACTSAVRAKTAHRGSVQETTATPSPAVAMTVVTTATALDPTALHLGARGPAVTVRVSVSDLTVSRSDV